MAYQVQYFDVGGHHLKIGTSTVATVVKTVAPFHGAIYLVRVDNPSTASQYVRCESRYAAFTLARAINRPAYVPASTSTSTTTFEDVVATVITVAGLAALLRWALPKK